MLFRSILATIVEFDAAKTQSIDSTTAKAHRCAAGGKGGLKNKRSAAAEAGEPRKSMPSSIAKAA